MEIEWEVKQAPFLTIIFLLSINFSTIFLHNSEANFQSLLNFIAVLSIKKNLFPG